MRRRLLLLAMAMAAIALPAHALTLTDSQAAAVKKAEDYLNGITTMKARFVQVNADGSVHEGDFYVSRPNRMRLVYDPPTPMLMVADGAFLVYVDKEMDDVSHIPLTDTPAGLLLKPNLSFTDPAVQLLGVHEVDNTLEITAAQAKDPSTGRVTFVFSENPLALRQWRVVDAQNKEVRVTLSNATFGMKLDKDLFRYDQKKNPEGLRGD
jgi:outer membrane lipoprotein-sorting protein